MMNPNVRNALLFTFSSLAARSVFSGSVFSAYVYLLTNHSNAKVGYISGIMGIINLVSGTCVGILVDRHRRDKALFVACAISLFAMVACLLAVLSQLIFRTDNNHEYLFLCMSWPLWGFFKGTYGPALQALFADSVPSKNENSGLRTKYYTMKTQSGLAAGALGPCIALCLFAGFGNEW